MVIKTIQTGYTLVSPAVPDRSTRKNPYSYTGLFQKKKNRIKVPVKCFYIEVNGHRFLVDAGWSVKVTQDARGHLGFGLYFASEPVMKESGAAVNQLKGVKPDAIYMTHLDCDHVSGLQDFPGVPVFASEEEKNYAGKKKLRYGNLLDGIEIQTLDFREDKHAPFHRSCDIFKDGSVIAYFTPTHSAGSVIYKITENGKYALIVGDNGYKDDSWKKGLLPGPIYNKENTAHCLEWIKKCSEEDACLGVFCAHNPRTKDLL